MVNEISKINVILYGVETDTTPEKTTTKSFVKIQQQSTKNVKEQEKLSGLDEVCISSCRYNPENDYINNYAMYMFQSFMKMMFNFMRMMINIITLQNIINSQIEDTDYPVFYQALQNDENVKKDEKEDKNYDKLVQDTIDALADDSLSESVQKQETKPAPKPAPVVVEQPKAEEKPVQKPAPVVVEQPKAEEKPVQKPVPVVAEQPKAEEKPVQKPVQVVVEQPKTEETKTPVWDWSKIEIIPKEKDIKPVKRTHDEILKDDRNLMLAMVKRTRKNDEYVLGQIKSLNDEDFKKMFCDKDPEFAKELSDTLYDGFNSNDIIRYILNRQSQMAPDGKKLTLKVSAGISPASDSRLSVIRQSDVPKKDTWVNTYKTIDDKMGIPEELNISQGDFERFYTELAKAIK